MLRKVPPIVIIIIRKEIVASALTLASYNQSAIFITIGVKNQIFRHGICLCGEYQSTELQYERYSKTTCNSTRA